MNFYSFLFDAGQIYRLLLTVTVSPEPTLITESGSFRIESLNSRISFLVHMEAAAIGGRSSIRTQENTVTNDR